jgi:hypothetical protein
VAWTASNQPGRPGQPPGRATQYRSAARYSASISSSCAAADLCETAAHGRSILFWIEGATAVERLSSRHAAALWLLSGPCRLADDFEAELVKAAERGQVRAGEGSVKHVEVFRMGGVGTPIIGRPRPLPGHHPRAARYTLNCEEPVWRPRRKSAQ